VVAALVRVRTTQYAAVRIFSRVGVLSSEKLARGQ
jgi:hypothetical protein